MLTYSFDNTGSDSLYEHLYKCIKNDILSGELAPDYKLPSKRSFAKNLGISTITVENAYAQLIAEGYIYSLPKKGYYVTDIAAVGQPVFAASYSHSQPENTNFFVCRPYIFNIFKINLMQILLIRLTFRPITQAAPIFRFIHGQS